MILLEHAGEKTILPEVAGPGTPDVIVLRVAAVNAAQQYRQGVLALRHGDEVNVVGHEAICQEPRIRILNCPEAMPDRPNGPRKQRTWHIDRRPVV